MTHKPISPDNLLYVLYQKSNVVGLISDEVLVPMIRTSQRRQNGKRDALRAERRESLAKGRYDQAREGADGLKAIWGVLQEWG